ncbi:MAG: AtpZ/AtpI family protein [Rhizobiaceae bacterium]
MPQNPKDPLPDELSHRLDALKERLGEPKESHSAKRHEASSSDKAGIAQAFRLSSEFIAGVLVGGVIGYGFDYFLGTSPWGLIVFVLLGFCAAILNVLRASGMVAESGLRGHKEPSSAGAEQSSRESNRNGAGQDQ